MVGSAILGVAVYLIATALTSLTAGQPKSLGLDEKGDLVNAAQMIKRIGRAATTCTRSGTVPLSTLQCTGTFFNNVIETYRFTIVNGILEYQRLNGGAWMTVNRYPSIVRLEVCADAELASNGATCAQNNGLLPGFRTPAADPVRAGRFFRYRLLASKDPANASAATHQIQSAFFVRNPGDIGNLITYQVGW